MGSPRKERVEYRFGKGLDLLSVGSWVKLPMQQKVQKYYVRQVWRSSLLSPLYYPFKVLEEASLIELSSGFALC